MREILQYVAISVWLLSLSIIFQGSSMLYRCQDIIPFYCQTIFHCVHISQFIHFSAEVYLTSFHLLALVHDAACEHACTSFYSNTCFLFCIHLGVELLDFVVILYITY